MGETQKAWLEDAARTKAVKEAFEHLTQQKDFVKRHGDGNRVCYFETVEKYMYRSLQPHARAALEFASVIQEVLKKMCICIPLKAVVGDEPVLLPVSAFCRENL